MDAFAITGVSPDDEWFRVQAAVGGVESPARLFPRIHVVRRDGIAALASGGRTIYFQQPGSARPLVPLAADDAEAFDPGQVPLEDLERFAFTETATEGDLEALLAVRNGDSGGLLPNALDRLEGYGWVTQDAGGALGITPVGSELLRHRLA